MNRYTQCNGHSFWTAAQALFHQTRLGIVESPAKASGNEWTLVYGGSCAYAPMYRTFANFR